MELNPQFQSLSKAELFSLGAVDPHFFNTTFFPRTFRDPPAPFHAEVDALLDGPGRFKSLQLFRGSSKTTRLRAFGARRIAYGLARTILWVNKSQDGAIESVRWLKKQVEHNQLFRETFQLSQGSKWKDESIEIIHNIEDIPIRVMAFGYTGSIRGVNIDDYRPDLILLDDILDEENTATPEQRAKVKGFIYGALGESLAPNSEAPHAMLCMLQTPLNIEDASMETLRDPTWKSYRQGCWAKSTEDLPLEQKTSAWETRFPTEELRKKKSDAIAGNRLSIFTREMECRIISTESSAFRKEWLRYYDTEPDDDMYSVLAIDPVPPPSDRELQQGLKKKDSECLAIVSKFGNDFFIREISINSGHEPTWTIMEFFRLAAKYRVKAVIVESIAYQRVLAWLLRQAMEQRKMYYPIIEYTDKRKKYSRILDALSGISSSGHLYVKPFMSDFIQQFIEYPNVKHDDILDAVAIAISQLQTTFELESFEDILKAEKKELAKLSYSRGAP